MPPSHQGTPEAPPVTSAGAGCGTPGVHRWDPPPPSARSSVPGAGGGGGGWGNKSPPQIKKHKFPG